MAMDFLFNLLFNRKSKATPPSAPTMKLMTSQLPALYISENNEYYHQLYITKLKQIGFTESDAEKMFTFECDIIHKFNKPYLTNQQFVHLWFFNLTQPFLTSYPKTKEDIMKEQYLTMSEICKMIDEAEWHFWNSHDRALPEGVWEEIYEWHLRGRGGDFAIQYFEMIADKTGIPKESILKLSDEQGSHLNKFKWQ